jgi:hypothetical protein
VDVLFKFSLYLKNRKNCDEKWNLKGLYSSLSQLAVSLDGYRIILREIFVIFGISVKLYGYTNAGLLATLN